jgi:hypothetical protein
MATATKERAATTFIAGSHNLRVVLKPRRNRMLLDSSGAVAAQPELAAKDLTAQPYLLAYNERAEREDLPLIDLEALPAHIDFKSQKFVTDDPNLILALRVHPRLGLSLAGFKERFATAEERLAEVAKLTAQNDVEGLRELLELEAAQGNHASVLEAGATALDALDTEAEPEGSAEGQTAEAGSSDDSQEPRDGPPNSPE